MFSVLYCFLYCTRLNIGSATPYLIEAGWSEATIGIMTGTLFWTYGIGQLINGRLCEMIGPAKLIIAAVVLSAAANLLVATQDASSVVLLAILWGVNGFFQSMGWTPGIAALTRWWPGKSRGFAVGFANAFSGFGQVAAYCAILVAYTWFSQLGWQAGFVIPAFVSLAVLVLYMVFAKATPAAAGLPDYEEKDPEKIQQEQQMRQVIKSKGALYPYLYILSNKSFLIWIIIAFSAGLARYGLSTWIPLYFKEQGLSAVESVASSLILPIGMGIGTLVVPWLTDRFCPEDRMPAAIISAVVGALATVAIFLLDASQLSQMILVEIMLFIAGFCIYAINGIIFTYATDIGGRVFTGTCSGLLNFSAYLGAAVQSVVYGFVLNNGGWGIVFVSITAFNLMIAVLGMIGSKKNSASPQ
jgi:sugar phosphate permease